MKSSNYRGVIKLCAAFQVYEKFLEARLRTVVEAQIADVQSAFSPKQNIVCRIIHSQFSI